ncbi:MAG: type IV pilus assembly protein PilM [Deltaproteobacteria bacterium]|nr:MAG: type IV pilus assembly protein PilM [Deltaproteobacteria bacterium]
MARGRNLLGLDIGASAVKACLLKEDKRGLALQAFDMVELPDEAIVEGAIINGGVVVDAIREILQRNRIKQRECALAVSGYSVIIKKITLPVMSRQELDNSIQWEAEQYIPFDVKDVHLDVEILATRTGQGQMDVLLVAAKKDTVADYANVAVEAGLEPLVMDAGPFTLQNMFESNYGLATGETSVLVDVGSAWTNIAVLVDGMTMFTRDIAMAGQLITEELQKQLNLTYEQAESYKRGEVGGDDGVVPREVETILDQICASIGTEVQRSLDFYAASATSSTFSRILLTGGSSELPGLGRAIAEQCGVRVELIDPFANVSIPDRGLDAERIRRLSPRAGVAVGLALRRSNES